MNICWQSWKCSWQMVREKEEQAVSVEDDTLWLNHTHTGVCLYTYVWLCRKQVAKDTRNRIYTFEKYKPPIEKIRQRIWRNSWKKDNFRWTRSFEKVFHFQIEVTIKPSLYFSEINNICWLEQRRRLVAYIQQTGNKMNFL